MSGGLRSVDEHLAAILTAMTPLPALQLPLLDALDLAAAEDVVAPIQLPRFDNSAMDGYAVR
ncbi:MAG: molybdopterin molybdenumtransferase MoeA, partial [Actinobacteria bacterium]|nr:molybdopterin molybdenumtransferase MoeA [Actinomycetota bacterium]